MLREIEKEAIAVRLTLERTGREVASGASYSEFNRSTRNYCQTRKRFGTNK